MKEIFLNNIDYYSHLIQPVKEERIRLEYSMESIFRNDIEEQYIDRVKWIVVADLALKLVTVPTDEILIFVETLNLGAL